MEPWVRKVLAIPVIAVALICMVAMLGATQAREDGGPGKPDESDPPFGMDYIPVRSDTVDMGVHRVVIRHNGQIYLADTGGGVTIKNQNLLPLARVPFFGQLTDAPYERSAFDDNKRVADVSAHDETLFVDLPSGAALPEGVVVFNQNNAFLIDEKFKRSPSEIPFVRNVVANAYYKADERNLLIMVRPSIILDGGLF